MFYIAKNEFLKLFKSVKSILIVLLFVFVSYFCAKFFRNSDFVNLPGSASPFYSSLRFLILFLGYTFISSLSHDCINKEVELQTIRLITSKVSRKDFLLGKFLGIFAFWFVCIILSSICIIFICKTVEISTICLMLFTCVYFISITIMVSTLVLKSSVSNFIGIILSVVIPSMGVYFLITENKFLNIFKYLFPYYYSQNIDINMGILIIISGIILYSSYFILNRKDL